MPRLVRTHRPGAPLQPLTPTPLSSPNISGSEMHAFVPTRDDARWFADQVHVHDGQLKAYLRSAYPAVRDVEDVVQESYLRLWRRHAAKPIKSAKNFLFSVARNLAVDLLRREQASPVVLVTDFDASSVMDTETVTIDEVCTNEEVSILLEAIDSLPPRCREILILRKLEGLSQKEIARQLGLSEETIQVQIGRGSRRCEELLRKHGVIGENEP